MAKGDLDFLYVGVCPLKGFINKNINIIFKTLLIINVFLKIITSVSDEV
jgi:hypothetical protein